MEFSSLAGASGKVFATGDSTVTASADTKAVFYDSDAKKVFITPNEEEYPGDSYKELTEK